MLILCKDSSQVFYGTIFVIDNVRKSLWNSAQICSLHLTTLIIFVNHIIENNLVPDVLQDEVTLPYALLRSKVFYLRSVEFQCIRLKVGQPEANTLQPDLPRW